MSESLAELEQRIGTFLNVELPAMADSGAISEPQLFEALGVIGLWTRAVIGPYAGADITQVAQGFVQALRDTYPGDTLPLAQRAHVHIEEAMRVNPALVAFRSKLEPALQAAPNEDATRAATTFLTYATAPESSDEIYAYFDVLLGGL